MSPAFLVNAPQKRLVFLRGKVVVELPAQRGNHSEAVWNGLLATVHASDESISQGVDVFDHAIEKHIAGQLSADLMYVDCEPSIFVFTQAAWFDVRITPGPLATP